MSGGTESNNAAIMGVALAGHKPGNHIITQPSSTPQLSKYAAGWKSGISAYSVARKLTWTRKPCRSEKTITDETLLVTVMHANNEVGTIQPIAELASIAHRHGALMHTDAAQSIAKMSVKTDELDVDLLSMAGHKLYAPKGIGALYVKKAAFV